MKRPAFSKRINVIYTRFRERNLVPPLTGNPYRLSLDGQTPRQTLFMWAKYLLAYGVMWFLLIVGVGLLIYPLALTILWLKYLLR